MARGLRSIEVLDRHWLLPTTVLGTYAVILLGIYTAAVGAGLTCNARWPLCDGAVFGLFPANWPSFIEWFHRLVAMVAGVLIIGSWIALARARSRRALAAMTGAVLLLPIQIWLGAGTVLGYELATLMAHFLVAFVIFTLIIAAAIWSTGLDPRRWPGLRPLFATLLIAMAPFVLLTPHYLFVHTGGVQMLYYGIGLFIVGCLVWVAITTVSDGLAIPGLATVGVALLVAQMVAGRVVRTDVVHAVDWAGAALTVMVLVLTVIVVHRAERRGTVRRPTLEA